MGRKGKGGRRDGGRRDRGERGDSGSYDPRRERERGPSRSRNLPSMMRRMFLGSTAEVSIIIRTHNGEANLEELLAGLRAQELPYETETMAVDAGSTDRTPLILRARGIRSQHVGEGKDSLQKVLEMAEGDVLVFLSQDTIPVKDDWLYELVTPLFEEEQTGLAYGRVIADATVPPYPRGLMTARDYVSGPERLVFDGQREVRGGSYLPPTNFAARRKALQAMGSLQSEPGRAVKALFDKGFKKTYLPKAVAVVKGEETSSDLFGALLCPGATGAPLPRRLLGAGAGLLHQLYELSDAGELPAGQRGEAYAHAIQHHATAAFQLATDAFPFLRKFARKA